MRPVRIFASTNTTEFISQNKFLSTSDHLLVKDKTAGCKVNKKMFQQMLNMETILNKSLLC